MDPASQPAQSNTPSPSFIPSSGSTNKLLIAIFVVLLLVIVGATAGYYYLNLKSKTPAPANNITQASSSPTPDPNQAVSEKTLDLIRTMRKDTLQSSLLTNTYKGTITELNTQGGISPEDGNGIAKGDKYILYYKFVVRDNNQSRSFYLKENDLKLVQFVKMRGKVETPIKYTDLKLGDLIEQRGSYELTQPYNNIFLGVKLIVLE